MVGCLHEGKLISFIMLGTFLTCDFQPYPGYFYTGDGAVRDKDGYIWIKGRVDGKSSLFTLRVTLNFRYVDVIKVSGHRLSTAEIESALILYPGVAEAAVVGAADEITGQAVHAFVTLKRQIPSS